MIGGLIRDKKDKSVSEVRAIRPPQVAAPSRIQLNSKGDIYALDSRQRRIVRLSPEGAFAGILAFTGVPSPSTVVPKSFAIDASDNLYVLDVFSARVLVVDAFHHFVQPSAALAQPVAAAELLRVLKPGGRLVVEEPDIRRPGVKLIAFMETVLLMRSRFLKPDDLAAVFRAAGAQVITVCDDGFSAQVVLTK